MGDEAQPPLATAGEPLVLVHHHPGRLRVRATAFRGDGAPFARVQAALDALPAIVRVARNPQTGSVLVEYEPGRVEPDVVVATVAAAAGLAAVVDGAAAASPEDDPAVHVVRLVKGLNAVTREVSGGRADLRMLVPGGLLAWGVYSLMKAPLMPRWENLFYWAYSTFVDLNRRTIADEAAFETSGRVEEDV